MKLRELLSENAVGIDDVAESIKEHCSDVLGAMLAASNGRNFSGLFRGQNNRRFGDVNEIRKDRRPVAILPPAHNIMHDVFLEMGFKATRTNSLFCSKSEGVAGEWGDLCIIFPFNGWTATVFDDLKTQYLYNNIVHLPSYQKMRDPVTPRDAEKFKNEVAELLKNVKARSIDSREELTAVLADNSRTKYIDMLFTGTKYISLPLDDSKSYELLKDLGFQKLP